MPSLMIAIVLARMSSCSDKPLIENITVDLCVARCPLQSARGVTSLFALDQLRHTYITHFICWNCRLVFIHTHTHTNCIFLHTNIFIFSHYLLYLIIHARCNVCMCAYILGLQTHIMSGYVGVLYRYIFVLWMNSYLLLILVNSDSELLEISVFSLMHGSIASTLLQWIIPL